MTVLVHRSWKDTICLVHPWCNCSDFISYTGVDLAPSSFFSLGEDVQRVLKRMQVALGGSHGLSLHFILGGLPGTRTGS